MNMMSGTMTGGCFRVVWVVGTLFATVSANAQPVNLIEERLDGVRSSFFELGPFYATPVIRLVSGYDSNALSTPDAQADINAMGVTLILTPIIANCVSARHCRKS